MGVFKEEMKLLEEFSSKQERIYNDAADHGIIATSYVKKVMRETIKTLLPLPGSEVVWKMDTKAIVQRQYNLRIYWSQDEYTDINVLYVNDRTRCKEFFSIS